MYGGGGWTPTGGGQPPQDLSQVPSALATSMTKDKKPFTYLPGGLDFSEIRSPRMAKRLAKHQATIIKVHSGIVS